MDGRERRWCAESELRCSDWIDLNRSAGETHFIEEARVDEVVDKERRDEEEARSRECIVHH